MLKLKLTLFSLLGIAVFSMTISPRTHAATVYDVNFAIGSNIVTGFIETDETVGVLSDGNLIDFTFNTPLFNGLPLTKTNSSAGFGFNIAGQALSATPAAIVFNFDLPGQFLLLDDPATSLICLVGNFSSDCSDLQAARIIDNTDGNPNLMAPLTGPLTLATAAPIPIPAALPLFLTAIAGLGGLRYMRRRKAA